QAILKLGPKGSIVVYLDGHPCNEKKDTEERRKERRVKGLERAEKCLANLEDRVQSGARLRKRHFADVRKNLKQGFHWSLESRRLFAEYMRGQGWNMVECPFEADPVIATDCRQGDIVVTRDSDALVYKNIETIWRPTSKGQMLVYDLPAVLSSLNLTRDQLTVLGIVSKNDYESNIISLGPATNFKIVKNLHG
ncbi:hypothetical protein BGX31_005523, partial [Mortierella sp. GBA43]